jgi:hypothetical protein
MPRRAAPAEHQAAPARAGPLCVLDPHAVFDLGGAMLALRLNKTTIRREVREGRLRVACRAGRRYILGSWLLAWLEEGELPRPAGANGQAATQ